MTFQVPPTARLSVDTQAALAGARVGGNAPSFTGSSVIPGVSAAVGEHQNRLLLAQAQAQARARAAHAAQVHREDELLMRLLLQRSQVRREPVVSLAGVGLASAIPPRSLAQINGGVTSLYNGMVGAAPTVATPTVLGNTHVARLQQAQIVSMLTMFMIGVPSS